MNDIAKYEATAVVTEGDPERQLEYAQRASNVLMKRIKSKPKPIIIGGRQYLEFGDWQTLGSFFGGTVATEWVRPIVRDEAIAGYEARAVVWVRGQMISAAEASCLRDEKNWAKRDEFAIKSMAQTRAGSKALRNAFGWVAELGGFAGTPAEEMEDEEDEKIEPPTPARAELNMHQLAELYAAIAGAGADIQKFCDAFRIKQIKDLPPSRLQEAKNRLAKWQQKQTSASEAEGGGPTNAE